MTTLRYNPRRSRGRFRGWRCPLFQGKVASRSFSISDRQHRGGERGVSLHEGCAAPRGRNTIPTWAYTVNGGYHRSAYNVTAEKCSWRDIHIPVYYPTLASTSYKNPDSLRTSSPKEHVTILIEARRNSDGSGATTRFYRVWFLAMGRDKKSREYFTIPFLARRTSQIRDVGAGVDVNLVPGQIKWINSTFLSRISHVDFRRTGG